MRNATAQSEALKFTPIAVKLVPTQALSVVPANRARAGLILSNVSGVACQVFLMPFASYVDGTSKPNFSLSANGGYWEDIKNYVGDIIIKGAADDAGTVNITEYL